nr:MAG TPA: hypothetical protein [Caudoviricetes sp.]
MGLRLHLFYWFYFFIKLILLIFVVLSTLIVKFNMFWR